MKTYWANFVKTGDPNLRGFDLFNLVDLRVRHAEPPFWPHFRARDVDDQDVQSLTPRGMLAPRGPHSFDTFRKDHFCATWEPLLTFNNGNEPEQP